MPGAGDGELDAERTVPGEGGSAILRALRRVEEADLTLRGRVRTRLHLGTTDLRALRLIARGDREGFSVRPRDIGRLLGMTSAAVTTVADRLVRSRLVERRADPGDGRGRILVLTDERRLRFQAAFGATLRSLHQLLDTVEEAEATRIVGLLEAVADALGLVEA